MCDGEPRDVTVSFPGSILTDFDMSRATVTARLGVSTGFGEEPASQRTAIPLSKLRLPPYFAIEQGREPWAGRRDVGYSLLALTLVLCHSKFHHG